MTSYRLSAEAQFFGTTIYVSGFLGANAAMGLRDTMPDLYPATLALRIDLRGVDRIDPDAFLVVIRTVNAWRDSGRRRVHIEFPHRESRRAAIRLESQTSLTTSAVNTAIIWPMSTSPG